jgi:hypothetical protein
MFGEKWACFGPDFHRTGVPCCKCVPFAVEPLLKACEFLTEKRTGCTMGRARISSVVHFGAAADFERNISPG